MLPDIILAALAILAVDGLFLAAAALALRDPSIGITPDRRRYLARCAAAHTHSTEG